MSEHASQSGGILNIGDLSKPVTVLIERTADFIGGALLPVHMKRVARAKAEVRKIEALSNIEVTEIEERGLQRFIREEGWKQATMENLVRLALPGVKEDAKPEDIPFDWLFNFFEKCRLISDEEMQRLWANILSSEANEPNSFSKRTVDAVASFDKRDAELFTNLCSFGLINNSHPTEKVIPFIYDFHHEIYFRNGINFSALKHLEDIGLISLAMTGVFHKQGPSIPSTLRYGSTLIKIEIPEDCVLAAAR
jgi:hypothetical protein